MHRNRASEILAGIKHQGGGAAGGKAREDWGFEIKDIGYSQLLKQKLGGPLPKLLVLVRPGRDVLAEQN